MKTCISQTAEPAQKETWFGWIEGPKQQLRTVVRVERDSQGKAVRGIMISPDESLNEIPLSEFEINAEGAWRFELVNSIAKQPAIQFSGVQTSAEKVNGQLLHSGETIPLKLQKLASMPPETRSDLGADSVWLGTLDFAVKKLEFRVRVYSSPPFGIESAPRFLFDSITQNVSGIPVQFTGGPGGKTTWEMKSIGAKFIGEFNESRDELDGRYIQNSQPLKLVFKRQPGERKEQEQETKEKEKEKEKEAKEPRVADSNKEMRPSEKAEPAPTAKQSRAPQLENPLPTAEANKSTANAAALEVLEPRSIAPTMETHASEFYLEVPFEVAVGDKPKKAKGTDNQESGVKLAGTITIPKQKNKEAARTFPAVVMLTGNGPHDRHQTIGRHRAFQTIARFLAENGIASLRYDDRGVGQSTGDYWNATSEDFAKDAIAVWKHARSLTELDPTRIGILGHSEGGMVGTMAAVWEPEIAFLILLAPPGVNGSELLKSQIDRISEMQGMTEADRKVTMALQGRLQEIAAGYFSDEKAMRRDIQSAIRESWEGLKEIAKAQDPHSDLDKLKSDLTAQIEGQFQQLRLPWYRFFLNYDPCPNWMMMRCPTLAMWGSNDLQVLPERNLKPLKVALDRNPELDAQLTIVPGLNHMLQASVAGLPEEYEGIEEDISPTALSLIVDWAKKHGLLDK